MTFADPWDIPWGCAAQLLAIYAFPAPTNSPRSLCESELEPVSFSYVSSAAVYTARVGTGGASKEHAKVFSAAYPDTKECFLQEKLSVSRSKNFFLAQNYNQRAKQL